MQPNTVREHDIMAQLQVVNYRLLCCAATVASCLEPFLPASLRPFRLSPAEVRSAAPLACAPHMQHRGFIACTAVQRWPWSRLMRL